MTCGGEREHRLTVADVDGAGRTPRRRSARACSSQAVGVLVGDRDRAAVGGEAQRQRAADARAGAGDDGRAAGERVARAGACRQRSEITDRECVRRHAPGVRKRGDREPGALVEWRPCPPSVSPASPPPPVCALALAPAAADAAPVTVGMTTFVSEPGAADRDRAEHPRLPGCRRRQLRAEGPGRRDDHVVELPQWRRRAGQDVRAARPAAGAAPTFTAVADARARRRSRAPRAPTSPRDRSSRRCRSRPGTGSRCSRSMTPSCPTRSAPTAPTASATSATAFADADDRATRARRRDEQRPDRPRAGDDPSPPRRLAQPAPPAAAPVAPPEPGPAAITGTPAAGQTLTCDPGWLGRHDADRVHVDVDPDDHPAPALAPIPGHRRPRRPSDDRQRPGGDRARPRARHEHDPAAP